MHVFVSWSGDRSKAVATLLTKWLKCVIQATKPWISTKDIDRGAIWFSEISSQLQETKLGIICVTQENQNAPWILFETGALAKGLSSSRVCPFLIDIEPIDVSGPLAQFNHTLPEYDSMFQLVSTINNSLAEGQLEDDVLKDAFEMYWEGFDTELKKILASTSTGAKKVERPENEILAEILSTVRSLGHQVVSVEKALIASQTTAPRPITVPYLGAGESTMPRFLSGLESPALINALAGLDQDKKMFINISQAGEAEVDKLSKGIYELLTKKTESTKDKK